MTNYDAFAETFSNSRKNMHWQEVDTILSDIGGKGYQSILDVGCGNGRFLGELRGKLGKNLRYLGIDASEGMIAEAKKLYPNESFLIGSMIKLESVLPKEKYDAIVFLASFHHLETRDDRKKCLNDLKKYLTSHGTVYFTNWNLLEQEKYQKNHRGNGDFDIKIGEFHRYYHGFTIEELTKLFEATGWKIEENKIFEGGRNIYSEINLDSL